MNATETLSHLVNTDSVSAHTNAEIVSYLNARCRAAGLIVKTYIHLDENGAEKLNLVAQTEASDQIELALVGHTDTVPFDLSWADALRLREQDGKLIGRGACDTKAFIAASLTAIDNIDLKKLKKPLALIFTADEEIGCLGAKRLADQKTFAVHFAIVGEPTSLQPMRAGKGYSLAEITLRGREAHSAYPELGASAIFRAARLIEQIEDIATELKGERHPDFDPAYTTVNVGLIKGGTARNIVAGDCGFTLEWRPIPGQSSDMVLHRVSKAAEELQKQDGDFRYEIVAARSDQSFETAADSRLARFLTEESGRTFGTVAFGTEAPCMIALGAEAIVFGPGNIRDAHRTGEFVPIDELNECTRILGRAIERFCG